MHCAKVARLLTMLLKNIGSTNTNTLCKIIANTDNNFKKLLQHQYHYFCNIAVPISTLSSYFAMLR